LIALDTDILAIHHIFTWDPRRRANEEFYQKIKGNATTSIHNLLELCGIFSLAGLSPKVDSVLEKYLKGREIAIIFPSYHEDWGDYVSNMCTYVKRGFSYGDALIAEAVEQSEAEVCVTWNKKHFEGKIKIEALTPDEYITR